MRNEFLKDLGMKIDVSSDGGGAGAPEDERRQHDGEVLGGHLVDLGMGGDGGEQRKELSQDELGNGRERAHPDGHGWDPVLALKRWGSELVLCGEVAQRD